MIYWPQLLPQEQFLELVWTPQSQVVETQTDTGPPMARRRFTAAVEHLDVPVIFTGWQMQYFRTWFNGTLGGGALKFAWTHPVTEAVVEFRFRGGLPGSWKPIAGGDSPHEVKWSGTLPLLVIP